MRALKSPNPCFDIKISNIPAFLSLFKGINCLNKKIKMHIRSKRNPTLTAGSSLRSQKLLDKHIYKKLIKQLRFKILIYFLIFHWRSFPEVMGVEGIHIFLLSRIIKIYRNMCQSSERTVSPAHDVSHLQVEDKFPTRVACMSSAHLLVAARRINKPQRFAVLWSLAGACCGAGKQAAGRYKPLGSIGFLALLPECKMSSLLRWVYLLPAGDAAIWRAAGDTLA